MTLVHIIAGPTASGKSAHAIKMAQEHNGVIINADSMQIYKALPMLTAQPAAADLEQAPHKLYATLQPDEHCSAGRWCDLALAEIHQALENNQRPIIVGGTGLYIKALTKGLSAIPSIDTKIRERLIAHQKDLGNPAFHTELATKDPVMAERLNPNDTQRLIRAYEVLEGTGKSLSHWQDQPLVKPDDELTFETIVIMPEREKLYERCNTRFEWMIENGVLDEVTEFSNRLDSGEVPETALVAKALGFRQLRAYIKDELSLEDALTNAQTETRRYAKRQMTWLRNQI